VYSPERRAQARVGALIGRLGPECSGDKRAEQRAGMEGKKGKKALGAHR
jgi:hypothetical protein